MELRHFRYFLAVADEENFSHAAKRLHISQSALSMQIQDLEGQLGAALFVRSNRRTQLTAAGTLFKAEAIRVIAQAERAKDAAARAGQGKIGQLRIGFSGFAAVSGKLVEDIRFFRDRFPMVDISLAEMAPPLQAEAIARGDLDIGYAPAFGAPFERELTADVADRWPWLIALSSSHELALRERITAPELVQQDFILYSVSDVYFGQLTTLNKLLGCEPRIVQRATNMLSLLTLVSAGLGVAMVPAPLAAVQMPDLAFRSLEEALENTTMLLLSGREEQSETAKAYRSTVSETYLLNR